MDKYTSVAVLEDSDSQPTAKFPDCPLCGEPLLVLTGLVRCPRCGMMLCESCDGSCGS